jgi:uncharacterized protein YecE (DUF72 family)
MAIRIGVSGWRYAPWRGVFYPSALPQRLELRYVACVFPTVEINGSFYSLQRPESWRRWSADTPDGFVFSVKGPRFITHMLKLRGAEQPLANFFASGVLALGRKLGPILWQLPPVGRFDPARIETFLSLLPRDTAAALRLARRRHPRMYGRSHLSIDVPRPLRHAMEVRHESFLDERFVTLLRSYGVALVVAETARRWPMPMDVTADFVYVRLHGDQELYRSAYGPAALARWAERIAAWHDGAEPKDLPDGAVHVGPRAPRRAARDVYCYFDNTDVKLRAPADARALMRRLGLEPGRWRGDTARAAALSSGSTPRPSASE